MKVGIGRSSFVDGYQGYGVAYEESRPMFFEALEVMRRAWGEEPFSYARRYYNFHDVNVIPKPFQKPHPPIRIAGESRASFAMMGKLGFPILIRHQMDIPERQQGKEGDEEAAIRLGRLRDGPKYEDLLPRLLYGTPEEIAGRIQEYRDALGITGVSLDINPGGQISQDRVVNSMRLLMERVAPRLN